MSTYSCSISAQDFRQAREQYNKIYTQIILNSGFKMKTEKLKTLKNRFADKKSVSQVTDWSTRR